MLTVRVTLADADRTTILQIGSVIRIDVECGTAEEAALSFRAIVEQTARRRAGDDQTQDGRKIMESANVQGLVEATDFERHCLWEKYHEQLGWEEHYGYAVTIGEVGDMPVCVAIRHATIKGYHLAFYDVVSAVVDHDMVRRWREKTYPDRPHTDASNFYNVLLDLERK